MDRNVRMRLAASWVWVALVAAYSTWGAIEYAGLFRWAAEAQIARAGGYSEKWTTILPGMVLAAPALWYIGRRSAIDRAAALRDPPSEVPGLKQARLLFGGAGIAGIVLAAAAWLLAQRVPDGSEPAIRFDPSSLGTAPAPRGKVVIRGDTVPGTSAGLASSGFDGEAGLYVGFRAAHAPAGGQVRLFVERRFDDRRYAAKDQFFLREQDGYLIENGLPGAVLSDLRRRGIAVAAPHYILRTSPAARRDPYYVAAGLGGFFGLMFLAFAVAVTLRAQRLARRAQ
jgi:hypothetical protein